MTIRKKMILILLACTIIPMCFVIMLGYYHARQALASLRMEELESIADLKAQRIETFFSEHRKYIFAAQHHPMLKKHTAGLAGLSGDFDSPAYATIRDELDRSLKVCRPAYDVTNVMLANPAGDIVYVLDRASARDLLGRSISELGAKSSAHGQNDIQISEIFSSRKRAGRFGILFFAPIRSDAGRIVGTAAFEADMSPVYKLIQNSTGLGKTGETLLVKKQANHALFLTPLRHDPQAALKRTVTLGQNQAIPAQEALKGHPGSAISVDYRGQAVIATWRYLPSLDWGMVAKIDIAEAYEPITTLRDFVLVLVVAVIVLSIFVAFIVAKSISAPIQRLHVGAQELGKGHLDHKVATNARDEIGQLGRAFDHMAQRLKAVTASRDELDQEIQERKKLEKKLQKSMLDAEDRIRKLNCLFEISRLMERHSLTLEEVLQGIVERIPPAWQYPDITFAKIGLDDQELQTENFQQTPWTLTQPIAVHAQTVGSLIVGYLEHRPQSDEGPFLSEERNLINAIAERIGKIIERSKAQAALVDSEKRFRDLVEHCLTCISIIQDGRIVYQNPEQERLLGPLPRPVKFTDMESIHPDDVEKVNAFYQRIDADRFQMSTTDFRFYPQGQNAGRDTMKWVHCQANRIEYQGRDAILVNIMDVTKAKELEHLLTVQDKMASLGRVAAGIAHEIRNPLSGINIYLNTLQKLHHKEGSEEKVDLILKQLRSASIKIESVIRRVMDFAKPSEPKLMLIDINEPISDALNLTAVTMRKSGIQIEKCLKDDLPRSYADKNLIEEMVLNLLNNAAEAMKTMQDGKKIVIASFVENKRIIIQVSDSGPGVPQEIRNKIMDPYFTTKHEGTGIGLSLCHRIITDHAGSLTVSESEFGGAAFRVEIPITNDKSTR